MQNIMEIHKKNNLFRDQITFSKILKKYFGALGVESPHGGAIMQCHVRSNTERKLTGS
jgi:hypothetical protein